MKFQSNDLINDLIQKTESAIDTVMSLKEQPLDILNRKPSKDSWSVLECVEHLNIYGEFYIPEIRQRVSNVSFKPNLFFKSGWLGNYFAKMMLPKNGSIKKMNTMKGYNPSGSNLGSEVLSTFLDQQTEMINLLNKSKEINLNKVKTSISISKVVKLKLGDTFRFVIYHNQRHLEQAKRALKN